MSNELEKYLSGEAMDEKCNCGVDHGSAEKNIAPSVVEGDEKATVSVAEDAAAKYLATCADDGEGVRKHADGSVCKAQSPDACPFNKSAEAGEKAITGKEKGGREKPVSEDILKKYVKEQGLEDGEGDKKLYVWKNGLGCYWIGKDHSTHYDKMMDIAQKIEQEFGVKAECSVNAGYPGDKDPGTYIYVTPSTARKKIGETYNGSGDRIDVYEPDK